MSQAEMRFEILEDGTISCETDTIPGVHHVCADDLLKWVTQKAGGERTIAKRRQGHIHQHQADRLRVSG